MEPIIKIIPAFETGREVHIDSSFNGWASTVINFMVQRLGPAKCRRRAEMAGVVPCSLTPCKLLPLAGLGC